MAAMLKTAMNNVQWLIDSGPVAMSTASPWQLEADAFLADYATADATTTETPWNTGEYGEGDYDFAKDIVETSTAAPWTYASDLTSNLVSDLTSDLADDLAENWRKTIDGGQELTNDVMATTTYWKDLLNEQPLDDAWTKRLVDSMMNDAFKNLPLENTGALPSKTSGLLDLFKPIHDWDSPSSSLLDDLPRIKSQPWDSSLLDDLPRIKTQPWDSDVMDDMKLTPWDDDGMDFAPRTSLSDFQDQDSPVSIIMKTITVYLVPDDDGMSMWRCAGVALGLVLLTLLVMALLWRLLRCCCCPKPKHALAVPTFDPERGYDASPASTGGYVWTDKQAGSQMMDPRLLDLYTKPGYGEKDPRQLDTVQPMGRP